MAVHFNDTQKAGGVSVVRATEEYKNASAALDKNREASKLVTDQAIKLKS